MSRRKRRRNARQLTRGQKRRLMYVENKDGDLDGADARIGWVRFSKTGRSVYYRGRVLRRAKGGGVRGNFFDVASGEEFWVSGVKKRGSNAHSVELVSVIVDADAVDEYERIRSVRDSPVRSEAHVPETKFPSAN